MIRRLTLDTLTRRRQRRHRTRLRSPAERRVTHRALSHCDVVLRPVSPHRRQSAVSDSTITAIPTLIQSP